jgi:hypothetical protein
MILYHGTNTDFETIDLSKSMPNKDFGRAFYLTDLKPQAEQMAATKVLLSGGISQVLTYQFDEELLSSTSLNVKIFKEYSKEWAEFIFANRDLDPMDFQHPYDIVYGPIADDRVGVQIRKFRDRYITIDELITALRYMKGITFQYAFCTNKAIDKLIRL